MISRYTRPEMGAIWTDENKFRIWLDIEVLACEAQHKLGVIPKADLQRIQKRARFDIQRIDAIEREVNHDVIAFLTSVAEFVGPSSRFIHKGMTSSDVIDTALAIQMVQAADLLIDGVKAVRNAAAKLARKHKFTPMIGRSHGIHAEPITFGLKLASFYAEWQRNRQRLTVARGEIATCAISGAVGTYANLDPAVERLGRDGRLDA